MTIEYKIQCCLFLGLCITGISQEQTWDTSQTAKCGPGGYNFAMPSFANLEEFEAFVAYLEELYVFIY